VKKIEIHTDFQRYDQILLLLFFFLQTVAPMDILRERFETLQQIHDTVQTFCEEQKNLYLHNLTQNIQTQFPSVTKDEVQVLLARHASTYGNRLVSSFPLYANWNSLHERMPLRVKEVMEMDIRRGKSKDFQEYQEAMKLPKEYAQANVHKILFPKKNTLLALQVINRLALAYEIRFEDVETVLKECMVI